jgi:hypothetical protein
MLVSTAKRMETPQLLLLTFRQSIASPSTLAPHSDSGFAEVDPGDDRQADSCRIPSHYVDPVPDWTRSFVDSEVPEPRSCFDFAIKQSCRSKPKTAQSKGKGQ